MAQLVDGIEQALFELALVAASGAEPQGFQSNFELGCLLPEDLGFGVGQRDAFARLGGRGFGDR